MLPPRPAQAEFQPGEDLIQRILPRILPLALVVLLAACSGGKDVGPPSTETTTTPAVMDTLFTSLEEEPALVLFDGDEDGLPLNARDWSLQDRALAFNPRLQELQEKYDAAMHLYSIGEFLQTQEALDVASAALEIASEDSLGNGLTQFYLSSLRTRLDLLQDILNEEAVMQFSAPLDVADDSLLALWYGSLPKVPERPLEIVQNDRVQRWINYFTGSGREYYQRYLERGAPYRPLIEETLERNGLPKELYFLAMIESGFDPRIKSSAGAVGPWQFIRGTGRRYGLIIDYWVDERRDFVRSTEAASQYLSQLYGIFQDWNLAMAGYNSGEFRVMAAMRRAGSRNYWDLNLPSETRDYVPKMMAAAIIGADPEAYGFRLPDTETVFRYEDMVVDRAVDLSFISKKGDVKLDVIKDMNPHLLRWCTPPDQESYAIHVPVGRSQNVISAMASLPAEDQLSFRHHKVKRGETLYDIAKGYGTTVNAIMRQNGIRNSRTLRAGSTLVIPTKSDLPYTHHESSGVVAVAEKNLPTVKVPDGMAKDFYTVRKGDNLSIIGEKLSVTVADLQGWNGLSSKSRIYPQQVLQFLRPARSGDAASHNESIKRTHVVRRGENIYQIGRLYGATVNDMLAWNPHLSGKKALIHPGDRLTVFTRS